MVSLHSVQNTAAAEHDSWHPDPAFRGTWGIISTCISTLLISVWSAIHFDLPPNYQKQLMFGKVRWLVIGLFAPDFLLFVAFVQLCEAWELSEYAGTMLPVEQSAAPLTWLERLRKCVSWGMSHKASHSFTGTRFQDDVDISLAEAGHDDNKAGVSSTLGIRKNPWTLTHSYYAAMGGFALDSSATPVFGTEDRLVISPHMLRFLMEHAPDLICNIPETRINCQSKSDWVAKALLVTQLLFFAVSCTTRLAQALPLSLLEVWTLAHALGAIIVYAIWWKKPRDVVEPTLITGERAREFAAYFQVVYKLKMPHATSVLDSDVVPEMAYLKMIPSEPSEDIETVLHEGQEKITLILGQSIQVEGHTFTICTEQLDPDNRDSVEIPYCPRDDQGREPDGSVSLGKADILRWQLFTRTAARTGGIWHLVDDTKFFVKAGGLRIQKSSESDSSPIVVVLFFFVLTVYELPHLLGWNAAFPTPVERMLWHVASIVVVALPIIACGYCSLDVTAEDEKSSRGTTLSKLLNILDSTAMILTAVSLLLYVVANMYLLVESLRQLSQLPDGAFILPNLSVYFPHFS